MVFVCGGLLLLFFHLSDSQNVQLPCASAPVDIVFTVVSNLCKWKYAHCGIHACN